MAKTVNDVVSWRPKPTLSLDAKDLSAIKDFKIGQNYTLTVDVKVTSLSKNDDEYGPEEGRDTTRARFRVTSAKQCKKDCCDCSSK